MLCSWICRLHFQFAGCCFKLWALLFVRNLVRGRLIRICQAAGNVPNVTKAKTPRQRYQIHIISICPWFIQTIGHFFHSLLPFYNVVDAEITMTPAISSCPCHTSLPVMRKVVSRRAQPLCHRPNLHIGKALVWAKGWDERDVADPQHDR